MDLSKGNLKSSSDNLEDIAERMQSSIDRWEWSLKVTGGAICPDKSFVYPINFIFKSSGNYSYKKVESMDITLSVKDEFGVREPL